MARTSRHEAYVVQPFHMGAKGLVQGRGERATSRPAALRRGEELAADCAGVAVLAMEVAEDVDFCGEPRVLALHGVVLESTPSASW